MGVAGNVHTMVAVIANGTKHPRKIGQTSLHKGNRNARPYIFFDIPLTNP